MRKLSLLTLFIIAVSGCTSVNIKPIDAEAAKSLKDQAITPTARKKPDFAAMTAGKAMFAMIGAATMISAGNEIIAKNNVADPADTIAIGLAKALEEKRGSQVVLPAVAVNEDDPAEIAAAANGAARFIVDVQTINWSFVYFPGDWSHYRVIYTAKARLIDAEKKTVVAEGFCKRIPDKSPDSPTYDELLADEAALLKKELSNSADSCISSLKTEMLAL